MKKVLLALSGGVDSSVAAYILKQKGYEVVAIFMKNFENNESNECSWQRDSRDAMMVAEKLGIPFNIVDLSDDYEKKVLRYMFDEYKKGRTPNPDILCNRNIKFDSFMDIARRWNFDCIATGHYCRKKKIIADKKTYYNLLSGIDENKDQSYFLCGLSQEQIKKSIFPIGEMTKIQVRQIANKIGLFNHDKKDSQGICFVGKVKLEDFLKIRIAPRKGKIILIPNDFEYHKNDNLSTLKAKSTKQKYNIDDGNQIGTHKGAFSFTVGQRKGIGVGGTDLPLYVLDLDIENNIVYVGQGKRHRGLYRKGLFVERKDIHWVNEYYKVDIGREMKVLAMIRYRQSLQKATIYNRQEGIYVIFEDSQFAISSGQFVAWYLEDILIGSGVIS